MPGDKLAAKVADGHVAVPRRAQAKKRPEKPAGEGSEMLHIRVGRTLKRDASATLEDIGLSMSDAVRLFLSRVVIEQALPLQLKVPNRQTRAAIEAARSLGPGDFSTPQELFDALEKASER